MVPTAYHSHNDYWRNVLLFSALYAGCTGVEADVWLLGDDLYVNHEMPRYSPAGPSVPYTSTPW